MQRLCDRVQRSVCRWKPWLQRTQATVRAVICRCGPFHSPGCCVTHRPILYNATHGQCACQRCLQLTHTDMCARSQAQTPTRIHSSASKRQCAVMDKQQARRPAATAITPLHDSDHIQTRSLSPRCEKHVCHVALWGFMCSPPHRSKYNYSASQWSLFIFSSATWSPGCDLNMTERTYHRIFESKAGEFRVIILLWRANAFTPTQIDSPWQKSLCCLFWAAVQDGKTWTPLLAGREVGLCHTSTECVLPYAFARPLRHSALRWG